MNWNHKLLWLAMMLLFMTDNPAGNLARGKPSMMSSLHSGTTHKGAVDGDTNALTPRKCSYSAIEDTTPWWIVDLLEEYTIDLVHVTGSSVMDSAMYNTVIELFTFDPTLCYTEMPRVCIYRTGEVIPPQSSKTFTCDPFISGRYLRITEWSYVNNSQILLCEVSVTGTPVRQTCIPPRFPSLFWTRRELNPSVTAIGLVTVTGCHDACMRSGSCLAYNHNDVTGDCEMIAIPEFTDVMANAPDWDYYGYRIAYTTSFVTRVVKYWMEQEIS